MRISAKTEVDDATGVIYGDHQSEAGPIQGGGLSFTIDSGKTLRGVVLKTIPVLTMTKAQNLCYLRKKLKHTRDAMEVLYKPYS